ncbi:MAG: hypothetical protein HY331_02955 [Chloroflexi bacterium]|nr:hypothetical protein [Chloroflexota bacterium]
MVCVLTARESRTANRLIKRLERKGLLAESKVLRDLLSVGSDRREVRASVAARVLHVSPQTVRKWVKRGLMHGRIDDTGHIYVPVEVLDRVSRLHAAMTKPPHPRADVSEDEILAEIAAYRMERRQQHARETS